MLFGLACAYRPPPAQTGDAVVNALYQDFDRPGVLPWESGELARMAQCVNGIQQLKNYHGQVGTRHSILGQIDERLTGAPHYWLALYWAGRCPPPVGHEDYTSTEEHRPQRWFLEEAMRRGVAGPAVVSLLAADFSYDWAHQAFAATPVSPAPALGSNPSRWPTSLWAAQAAAYRKISRGQQTELLQRLAAAAQDDAGCAYVLASIEAERGDLAAAQRELEHGNSLPFAADFQCVPPRIPWIETVSRPETYAMEDADFGFGAGQSNTPNIWTWQALVRKLAWQAAQHADRAAMQELHIFSCRFGAAQSNNQGVQLAALALDREIVAAVRGLWPMPLTASETARLSGLGQQHLALKNAYKAVVSQEGVESISILNATNHMGTASMTRAHLKRNELEIALCQWLGNDYLAEVYLNDVEAVNSLDCQLEQANLAPLWTDLAAFDYRTMSFPAPALSPANAPR